MKKLVVFRTRTDSPSSGLGQRTEEKLGSGSFCSGTGIGGAKPKISKACWTKTCPTPWKDEWMNFRGQLLFRSLREEMGPGLRGRKERFPSLPSSPEPCAVSFSTEPGQWQSGEGEHQQETAFWTSCRCLDTSFRSRGTSSRVRVTEGELNLSLPVEAEGGKFVHVAAVDLGQGVGTQGGALHQLLVPAGGAPGLQMLLDALQDLLVVRCTDLSAITPVYLQRIIQTDWNKVPVSLFQAGGKRFYWYFTKEIISTNFVESPPSNRSSYCNMLDTTEICHKKLVVTKTSLPLLKKEGSESGWRRLRKQTH